VGGGSDKDCYVRTFFNNYCTKSELPVYAIELTGYVSTSCTLAAAKDSMTTAPSTGWADERSARKKVMEL